MAPARALLTIVVAELPDGSLTLQASAHSTTPAEIAAAAGCCQAMAWEAGRQIIAGLPRLPREARGGLLIERPKENGRPPQGGDSSTEG